MTDDLFPAEQALRAMLADRAADAPTPLGLYETARRRTRRRRTVLVLGTAVAAVVAVGLPTLALGSGGQPAPVATTPAPVVCPPEPGPAAPGLRPQGDVRGSLGGDRAAVTAVLRVGWQRLRRETGRGTPLNPAAAKVVMVHRAADGVIVGLVGATGSSQWLGRAVIVTGTRLDRLSSERLSGAPGESTWTPLSRSELTAVAEACGRPKVVVVASPRAAVKVTRTVGVDADGTVSRQVQPVPLRWNGVAVLDRSAEPTAVLSVWTPGPRGAGSGSSRGIGPKPAVPACIPADQGCLSVEDAVAAAPGDGDRDEAVRLLRRPGSLLLPSSGLRVLWRGTASAGTVTAAVTTLPSGAQYVWGGQAVPSVSEDLPFRGILPAGGLERTALVLRSPTIVGRTPPPGAVAVIVPGAATVRATVDGVPRTVAARDGVVFTGRTVTGITATRADGGRLTVLDTLGLESPYPRPFDRP